jgi:hypothetical protein
MQNGLIQRATAATVAQWIAAISLFLAPVLDQNSPSSKLLRQLIPKRPSTAALSVGYRTGYLVGASEE